MLRCCFPMGRTQSRLAIRGNRQLHRAGYTPPGRALWDLRVLIVLLRTKDLLHTLKLMVLFSEVLLDEVTDICAGCFALHFSNGPNLYGLGA